jgi:hypothetical protein
MSSIKQDFSQPQSGNSKGVVDQTREFGRDLKDQAGGLTEKAAEVVKTQAANLMETGKDLAADTVDKLRATVTEQKAAGADYVQGIAGMVRRSASEFDSGMPQAGQYIRKAATQLENVSEAMRNKDMSEIVGNVQDFARKQPTAFFGAAVLLGFAAVRFLKSGSETKPQWSTSNVKPQGATSNFGGSAAANIGHSAGNGRSAAGM